MRSQAFKIYGARKKKTEAVKCPGYFINKEKMGFAINIHLIKYRNTVLGNRDSCLFLQLLHVLNVGRHPF